MRIHKTDIEKAEQAKLIIEKEYYKQHTYQDLAQLVCTNVSKLQVTFKMVTNLNLYEYYSMIRVEKAMELLENTELTIDAIAARVGIDRTNLNKQFKKIKGISPGKWRLEQEKEMHRKYVESGRLFRTV
jgi:transcriptional regulator GlxA family with amidase domain